MEKLKGIVKTFLFVMCVMGMFSMSVYATEECEEVKVSGEFGDLIWELKEGVLTISGEGDMISGNQFSYPWLEYRSDVDRIVIEEGVTSIGMWAFSNNAAKSVTIPEGVSNIAPYAFMNCYNLEEVNLPDNMDCILYGAFKDCSKLTDTELQNILSKVKTIDRWVFVNCDGLTRVHIPANITNIKEDVFSSCDNIHTISVDTTNEFYCEEGNVLFDKEQKNLLFCPPLGMEGIYTVPDTVNNIGSNAFKGCRSISSIIIPESVTKIGIGAFSYCSCLQEVNIPQNVTVISSGVFEFCKNLKAVELPQNLKVIGSYAFHTTAITDIEIPKTVTTIGDYALGYTHSNVVYGGEKINNYIIRGYAGTAAEEYATNNDMTFSDLSNGNSYLKVMLFISIFTDVEDEAVVKLIGDGGELQTIVSGYDTSCLFNDISAGSYILEISKKNYVTRTYTVNVGEENIQQEVEIQLVGDITGDSTINARDKKLIYNHMAGTSLLTDYTFLVGDVTNDGAINARDKKLIYNHIAGASSLWE